MQAMILAAGFGTRLRPYSDHLPKPLFPLFGTPLLLLQIRRLQRAGFDHIVVNCHYKREMIRQAVAGIPGLVVQEEEMILGTGGGLRRALGVLRDEPLLVVNGDIYHSIDPGWLYRRSLHRNSSVLLAVHRYPRFNVLQVAGERLLGFDGGGSDDALAFTGVHVLNPALLEDIAEDRQSCIIEHYRSLLAGGHRLEVERVDQCYWRDIGTPTDYLLLHRDLLRGSAPRWEEIAALGNEAAFLAEGAQVGENFRCLDWCAIGRAEIGRDVTVGRSVIWDGAVIEDGSVIEDRIVV